MKTLDEAMAPYCFEYKDQASMLSSMESTQDDIFRSQTVVQEVLHNESANALMQGAYVPLLIEYVHGPLEGQEFFDTIVRWTLCVFAHGVVVGMAMEKMDECPFCRRSMGVEA